ncbi:hypothetical protein [Marinobacter sp. CHS3-4]|uniref:hypothetical protein n=1 Tax=Marinobacter sp. CHS3-4 TaxID=3045174 RepID=UPI0024B4C5E7|nr:hypothetical protein [Marinobacter sp. CHS3-4]MDI9246205.1 hypothetical protein [Marinobacter sp. CHS3-4]
MRALAQFVMRGPLQAGGVAVAATLVPLLFWIGAAVIGLVILRLGVRQGLNIGLWALLPALGWAWVNDPTSLVVLLQVFVVASVLRVSQSWEKALMSGTGLAIVTGWLLPLIYPDMLDSLVQTGVQFYEQYNAEMAKTFGDSLETVIRQTMIASMAGTYLMVGIGMTMLARSWQAKLYNPGGFQKEFHALRLSPAIAVLCVVITVGGSFIGLNPMLMGWAGAFPLVLAGLGLIHGSVRRKGLSGQWLVLFYLALVFLGPSLMILLLVLAFVDSWLDIRGRIKPADPAE